MSIVNTLSLKSNRKITVFKAVLEKDSLASQPAVSRFFNHMDEDTLNQFLLPFLRVYDWQTNSTNVANQYAIY